MYRNALKPGDTVTPGVYWVHHYQHRLAHVNTVALESFPECRVCGSKVRYTLAQNVADTSRPTRLRLDSDFVETSKDIPIQFNDIAD